MAAWDKKEEATTACTKTSLGWNWVLKCTVAPRVVRNIFVSILDYWRFSVVWKLVFVLAKKDIFFDKSIEIMFRACVNMTTTDLHTFYAEKKIEVKMEALFLQSLCFIWTLESYQLLIQWLILLWIDLYFGTCLKLNFNPCAIVHLKMMPSMIAGPAQWSNG